MKPLEIDLPLALAAEESEAIYWSKHYRGDTQLRAYVDSIKGALLCAVPELDILAMNRLIGLGMQSKVDEVDIETIVSMYQRLGVARFFVQLSPHIMQPALPSMLKEGGFVLHNSWSKLMFDMQAKPLLEIAAPFQIREIGTEEAELYARIIFECFDWTEDRLVEWLAKCVGQRGYTHYIAFLDGHPAAAAALHINGQYASMAFAATLPQYRGLGAQRALILHRLKQARDKGCRYAFSETATPGPNKKVASHNNMLAMGFEELYQRDNWLFTMPK